MLRTEKERPRHLIPEMWGAGQRGGECKEIHTKETVALWTSTGQQEGLVRLAGCSELGRKGELVQA